MTERAYPDWIEAFLNLTEKTEPPRSFRFWTAVGTLAAVLQRKCWLKWGGTLYPNMYLIFVAPGGKARKSFALDMGREILEMLGIEMAPETTTREALIRRLKNSNFQFVEGNRPIYHHSLTAFSSELTVLLGYKNQQFMADLCDWFDCRKLWRYETKDKKLTDNIHNLWFNLIGGTTPESLAASLPEEAIGGGLTSRIIFICEDKKGKVVYIPPNVNTELWEKPFTIDKEIEEEKVRVKDALGKIHLLQGEFKVTEDFADIWIGFKKHHEENPLFENTPLSSYNERRQIHILKLCMILNASRSDEMIMKAQDLERAIDEITKVERYMLRAFAGVGGSPIATLVSNLTRIIITKKSILYSDLMKIPNIYYNADDETVRRALGVLLSQKVIDLEYLDKDGEATKFQSNSSDMLIKYIK